MRLDRNTNYSIIGMVVIAHYQERCSQLQANIDAVGKDFHAIQDTLENIPHQEDPRYVRLTRPVREQCLQALVKLYKVKRGDVLRNYQRQAAPYVQSVMLLSGQRPRTTNRVPEGKGRILPGVGLKRQRVEIPDVEDGEVGVCVTGTDIEKVAREYDVVFNKTTPMAIVEHDDTCAKCNKAMNFLPGKSILVCQQCGVSKTYTDTTR
jgi:hypothetical protein